MKTDMREVLHRLEEKDIHIHPIDPDTPLPFVTTAIDTHYAMRGDEILAVGSVASMVALAYNDNF